MHTGIDWVAPVGSPVTAAAGGKIRAAGRDGPLGNRVEIDHGAGWSTLYAHLARIVAIEGGCVGAGDTIGYLGATGLVADPHLHLEVWHDGRPVDPMSVGNGGPR